ncbi:metal-binding protein ZinT [Pseudorhizobium endolithicum]|uniref:Metal-binding protein ZinT n=1 Tax=Pseudorhizobium endolithicum TaxID=1191678 RepID=A0ABN7JM22_9HYPH|nr:metal-binding protein ZinT [Pseudorhizobium endolithicum]
MKRLVMGVSALALSAAFIGPMAFADEDAEGVTLYRVFVGDHEAGKVTAFDLNKPENRWTFETTGQNKLYSVNGGSAIVSVQSDDDAVNFINSGISLHSHGDHSDIDIEEPSAVSDTLTGPRPFHVIDHDGKVVINFDKGGYAEIVEAHKLAHNTIESKQLKQARPHHGFAAPIGNGWVTTVASDAPVEGDAAPTRVGLRAVNEDGTPTGDVATCTGIHGEAFSGAYLAAGCKEGILTVTAGKDGPVTKMLTYPADLPSGEATGTLLGAKSMQVFLGNYGAKGLVIVDPVDEPHFRYIELPFRRVDFALDPANARFGYVLTEDGSLHQVDVLDGKLSKSAKVTEPYSMDGHWNDPRPRIAMAGDEIVMTDPNARLVRRIAKDELTEVGTIEVEGKPYNIAVAGGSGKIHEGEERHDAGHDHNHDGDEHAHSHGDPKIYAGYFEDSQVKDRPLSDYAGDWQSVYPYLKDGTLEPVWEHKAEKGTSSVDEIRAEYEVGYRTDVDRITIEGDVVTFYRGGTRTRGNYAYDGKEILTYKKGNRGVRFIFKKIEGDADAPQFIQFSDHKIAPEKAEHYHLYWGDDRAALLDEVTNWPTYYPSSLTPQQIVSEMKAH